jgi:uncharacterized protein (DUF2267 family)
MSSTGLSVFDSTINITNVWLNEIMEEGGWRNKQTAYVALRAVLHALRDRLSVDEAAHLGAQLPMLIRGIYYEGWDPSKNPTRDRSIVKFLDHIASDLRAANQVGPEACARAVFAVLSRRISEGEIDDIRGALPAELQALWPEPV